MAEGLAAMATYGSSENNTTHYYAGSLDKPKKLKTKKKCKKKPKKEG